MTTRIRYDSAFFDGVKSTVSSKSMDLNSTMREIVKLLDIRSISKKSSASSYGGFHGSSSDEKRQSFHKSKSQNDFSFQRSKARISDKKQMQNMMTKSGSSFVGASSASSSAPCPRGFEASSVNHDRKFQVSAKKPDKKISLQVQAEREITIQINGVTDEVYIENAQKINSILETLESEDLEKTVNYLVDTLLDLSCKQSLYAISYAFVANLVSVDIKKGLEDRISMKIEEVLDKSLPRNQCKSFAKFLSGLEILGKFSVDESLHLLDSLLKNYESEKNDNSVEFVTVYLCTLESNENKFLKSLPDITVRERYSDFLKKLAPYFTMKNYAGMRLLDVKECFSL